MLITGGGLGKSVAFSVKSDTRSVADIIINLRGYNPSLFSVKND